MTEVSRQHEIPHPHSAEQAVFQDVKGPDMSMSFGDKFTADPTTARGREWPCLRQFCVFLENRVGRLHDLLRYLESHELRVMALSIVDSVDFAVARVLLDNYERGHELFQLSNFNIFENDIIGVELPSGPQPYVSVCVPLLRAEINIHYTYPLLYRRQGRGAIAMFVDDLDQSLQVLQEQGLRIITENDLLDDDEFL